MSVEQVSPIGKTNLEDACVARPPRDIRFQESREVVSPGRHRLAPSADLMKIQRDHRINVSTLECTPESSALIVTAGPSRKDLTTGLLTLHF
jgi:hypothetical protein